MMEKFKKDVQYYKFCAYGFLKSLQFFEIFIILFLRERGLSFTDIGILYAIRETCVWLLEIPTGALADIIGRKKTMILSFSAYIISFVIFYLGYHFYILAVAMVIYAIGDSLRSGTHKAMIFDYLKHENMLQFKTQYYGYTRSASKFGSAFSALFAAFVVFITSDYGTVFLVTIIPYLLNILLIISYPKYLDKSSVHEKGFSLKDYTDTLKPVLKDNRVYAAFGMISVFDGFFKSIKDYIQPIIKAAAVTLVISTAFNKNQNEAVTVGVVYFVLFILTAYSSRMGSTVAQSFKSERFYLFITAISGALLAVFTGAALILRMPVVSIIPFILIYMLQNMRRPSGVSLFADLTDSSVLATALSADALVQSISASVLAIVTGVLADRWGIGVAIIVLSAIMILFWSVLNGILIKKESK
ncbi:MAG: MFS transporter [Candidatus Cloacimonetes bacterium]|nr:MFS transporter [Candidatus Cloacimonadota bacterium]